MSRLCPCTSKRTFNLCCEPFLTGKKLPATPEQLMRSRFSAYALGKVDYLIETTAEEKRSELDKAELVRYCAVIKCISLKIVSSEAGKAEDDAGIVTFHASLQINGRRTLHIEKSRFAKVDGRWFYVDGDTNEN